ncbi:MAG: hypothetical protein GC154_12990 [bacterium]|nr:hypothetical protein [bacterium]
MKPEPEKKEPKATAHDIWMLLRLRFPLYGFFSFLRDVRDEGLAQDRRENERRERPMTLRERIKDENYVMYTVIPILAGVATILNFFAWLVVQSWWMPSTPQGHNSVSLLPFLLLIFGGVYIIFALFYAVIRAILYWDE